MKIGILTLPLHTNYGGILQAYALQTVLERMGHEVYIIRVKSKKIPLLPIWKRYLCYAKRAILKYIFGEKDVVVFHESHERALLPVLRQNTNKFIAQYIHSFSINNFKEIENKNIFNAYVVGSDQIWRPLYSHWDIEDSFLRFDTRPDIIRIAYATSLGVDTWEYTCEQTENCRKLAQLFNTISVREDSAVNLCKKYLGVDANWVLDPTMLLDVKDYLKLAENAKVPKCSGNLLVYLLNTETYKNEIINNIVEYKGLIPILFTNSVENPNLQLEERIHPMVESWLKGFIDAKYVVTDSFHGCVFSILFHKPFSVMGNEGRGMARIKSLLELFNLKNRFVESAQSVTNIENDIDWERIDSILDAKRKESMAIFDTLKPKS